MGRGYHVHVTGRQLLQSLVRECGTGDGSGEEGARATTERSAGRPPTFPPAEAASALRRADASTTRTGSSCPPKHCTNKHTIAFPLPPCEGATTSLRLQSGHCRGARLGCGPRARPTPQPVIERPALLCVASTLAAFPHLRRRAEVLWRRRRRPQQLVSAQLDLLKEHARGHVATAAQRGRQLGALADELRQRQGCRCKRVWDMAGRSVGSCAAWLTAGAVTNDLCQRGSQGEDAGVRKLQIKSLAKRGPGELHRDANFEGASSRWASLTAKFPLPPSTRTQHEPYPPPSPHARNPGLYMCS
eukprot:365206-Chlamydomonas_euryale.AAC.1